MRHNDELHGITELIFALQESARLRRSFERHGTEHIIGEMMKISVNILETPQELGMARCVEGCYKKQFVVSRGSSVGSNLDILIDFHSRAEFVCTVNDPVSNHSDLGGILDES